MPYITVIATVIVVIVNVIATALPLGGQTTKEISDSFKTFFVPAGYVFSIWGIIYIALLTFSIVQLKKKFKDSSLLKSIRGWYLVSSLANISWILLWQFHFPTLSLIPMIILLISLIQIYYKISKSKEASEGDNKYVIKLPFSIYLGWISVATIANAAVFLYVLNWNGFGIEPQFWSSLMIFIAGGLGLLMLLRERDYAYVAVLIWATIGIVVKFIFTSRAVSFSATFVAIVLFVLTVVMIWDDRRKKHSKK